MKRRLFVKAAAAAGLGTAVGWTSPVSAKPKTKWRLVMSYPRTSKIIGETVLEFAKRVKQLSQGKFDIAVYGAGELVPSLEVFETVKSGTVEMGYSSPYYWMGKINAAAFFSSIPFGMKAIGMKAWLDYGGGQKLWDEVYRPHGVFGIASGAVAVQMGGWFNRKINTIEDYKNLKMRIPGIGGKVIEKVGGKPMLVGAGEIFTNLATGVIDAAEFTGPHLDYYMGFHKAAKYYYYPGWHEPGTIHEFVINKSAWDKLSVEFKNILQVCSAEIFLNCYTKWLAKDAEYLSKMQKMKGISILPFPDSVLKILKQKTKVVIDEMTSQDSLAKKVYASYADFQNQFQNYQLTSDLSYDKTIEM